MSDERQQTTPVDVDAALSDEAIDWLVRLGSGRATLQERQAFQRWRQTSLAHEAAAAEAEAVLRDVGNTSHADRLRRERATLPAGLHQMQGSRRVSRRFVFGAVAVSAAAAAVALPALGPFAAFYADHATRVGERSRLVLEDGSVIVLNTATALSVDFSSQHRRIALHAGEALFEVTRDRSRPFIVTAGDADVRAIGTVFAVRRGRAFESVVVSEGAVEVKMGQAPPVRLGAGQYLAGGEREGRAVDVDLATAWRRGKLIFNRRSLENVVAELQRYRTDRIVILDDRLKALQLTGVFDLDDTDRLLRTVGETGKARIVRLPLMTLLH